MPWCDTCERFQDSDELDGEGHCPSCGTVIAAPKKKPWHFKLLIVATILYLTYRLIQLILWLHHVL